jgi:hypothetical protein
VTFGWGDLIFDLRPFSAAYYPLGQVTDATMYLNYHPYMYNDPSAHKGPYNVNIKYATFPSISTTTVSRKFYAVEGGSLYKFDYNAKTPGTCDKIDITGQVNNSLGKFLVFRIIPDYASPGLDAYPFESCGDNYGVRAWLAMTLEFPDQVRTWGQMGGEENNVGGYAGKQWNSGMWGQPWGVTPKTYQ